MQVEWLMPKFHGRCEPIDIQNLQFSISIQFNLLFELKDFFWSLSQVIYLNPTGS